MATLDEPLGTGPVAAVYATGDVVLKVFPGGVDRRTRAAWERESGRWARVPGTRVVHGVEVTGDGRVAVRAERCRDSLAGQVRVMGPLAVDAVVALGRGLASVLAAAHAEGLVHGGVTPHNVLFRDTGECVLADGGLVPRNAFPVEPPAGTAAPETVRDAVLDARTDLHGLGAVLYFALTGQPPRPARLGEGAEEHALRVLREPPPEVERPDVPLGLAKLVRGLLDGDPQARPRDVLAALDAFAGPTSPTATLPQPGAGFAGPQPVTGPQPATGPQQAAGFAGPQPVTGPQPVPGMAVQQPVPGLTGSQPVAARPDVSWPVAVVPAGPQSAAGPAVSRPAGGRVQVAEAKPERDRDWRGRLGLVAGVVGALAMFAAAPFLLLRDDPPTPSPQAPPVSAPQAAPEIEVVDAVDGGDHVRITWRGPDLDYVIISAPEGRDNSASGETRERTARIPVEPGLKYCFEVHGTNGRDSYRSKPHPIREAKCAR